MNKAPPPNRKSRPRRIRVAVIGISFWLEVVAELLRRAGITCEVFDLPSKREYYKWFLKGHWRGFDAIHNVLGTYWAMGTAMAMVGKPVIWHWIGSDVLRFRKAYRDRRGWKTALVFRSAYQWAAGHLAVSAQLAQELEALGIRAPVVGILTKLIEAEVEPLPEKFTVLSYWSDEKREFYRGDIVLQLADEFPEIEFRILMASGKGETVRPNVKFLGYRKDMPRIYSESSVLIRLPEHDGLPQMPLEMLIRGRYVIYNKDFPFTESAGCFQEARDALARLLVRRQPNEAGADYVRRHYSLDEQAERLRQLYARWFQIGR